MNESVHANFDDMGCMWNAGHVICRIFSTSRGKRWTSLKTAKTVMKGDIGSNTTYKTHIKNFRIFDHEKILD